MYENMINDVKDKMQPMMDMAEINKKAAEKLFALQSAYVTEFMNSCLCQMQAIAEVRDPKQLVELQMDYFKQLECNLTDVAEKELAALNEAKDQLTEVVEKSFSEIGEMPYFTDMSKYMTEMVNAATAATQTVSTASTASATEAAEESKAAPKKAPMRASRKPGSDTDTAA